jgi:putative transposase
MEPTSSKLSRVVQEVGDPHTIRLDNDPEFIRKDFDLWAFMHSVTLDFSRPRKSRDNAFIESLNGKFRPSTYAPTGS